MINSKKIVRGKVVLYFVTFLMGGCGIAYEYTFSKVASDFLGNSVQQWAIIIGIMMFFMGVGADIQKYIKDRDIFDRFILFELLLGLVGGFGPLLLLYVFGHNRDYFALVQYSLTIITGLFIGLEIPILSRINERFSPELKLNIGGIIKMDYIGAFVGALVWVFLLPKLFSLIQTAIVLGLINNGVSLIALLYFRDLTKKRAVLTTLLSLSLILLSIGYIKAPQWTHYTEQWLFLDPIIASKTTPYQHIVVTRHRSGEFSCYINGHLQFYSGDEAIYHEFLVHPAMSIAPIKKKVLVLGGGDGLAVREILKYSDVDSVTLVDLDPEMTNFAKNNEYFTMLNRGSLTNGKVLTIKNGAISAGKEEELDYFNRTKGLTPEYDSSGVVSVINLDAARFLDQIKGLYDVIIIDFPDPNSLELSKLYSRGFYERVYKKLSRDGVMIQQSSSPVYTERAFSIIGKTMESAGFTAVPYHENVPSFGEWGWWIAKKNDRNSRESLAKELKSIDSLQVNVSYITPELIRGSLNFGKNILKFRDDSVNTIVNNVVFRYYISELKKMDNKN